jgi:predicted PurR-regulated permease PerM
VLWAAQDLILPVLLAMFFALIGNPIIRVLQRLWIPRFLGALLVLAGGLFLAGVLGNQLIEPAGEWVRQAPRELKELAPKLREMVKPMQEGEQGRGEFRPRRRRRIQAGAGGTHRGQRPLSRPHHHAAHARLGLAVVLLTFFFMVYGEGLQRNAIALLQSRQQKKFTVEVLQSIEAELSRYVLTISVINRGGRVGTRHFAVLPRPAAARSAVWGTMATLLNFAPYVGPLIGIRSCC